MNSLVRNLVIGTVFLISAVGCTRTVYITEDPPAPKAETQTPSPGPRYSWIDGHWRWNGNRYVWDAGHWQKLQGNKTWVAGHWERGPRGHFWVPGHWRR